MPRDSESDDATYRQGADQPPKPAPRPGDEPGLEQRSPALAGRRDDLVVRPTGQLQPYYGQPGGPPRGGLPVPVLYGIISVLLLAIGILLGFLLAQRGSAGGDSVTADDSTSTSTRPVPSPSSSIAQPTTESSLPTSASGSPATGAVSSVPVTYSGEVRITDGGINLAGSRPGQGDAAFATLIYDSSTGQFDTNNSSPAALWLETTDPTYEQCADRISAQALSGDEREAINYEPNLGICVVPFGENDKIVFIRIVEQPTGEAAQSFVIMWAPR